MRFFPLEPKHTVPMKTTKDKIQIESSSKNGDRFSALE
jgi:hypothetical protein